MARRTMLYRSRGVWLFATWPLFFLGRKNKTPLGQAEDADLDLARALRGLLNLETAKAFFAEHL